MKAVMFLLIFATAVTGVPVPQEANTPAATTPAPVEEATEISAEFKLNDLIFNCKQQHLKNGPNKDSTECKRFNSKTIKACVIADPKDAKKCLLCENGKKLVTNGDLSVCAAIPDYFVGRQLFTFVNPFDKGDLRCTYHKEWTSGSKKHHTNVLVSAPCDKLDETGIKNLISASADEKMGSFAMNLRSNKESKFNIMKFASTQHGWTGECGDRDGNVQCSSDHYLNTPLSMDAEGFILLAGRGDTEINSFKLTYINKNE